MQRQFLTSLRSTPSWMRMNLFAIVLTCASLNCNKDAPPDPGSTPSTSHPNETGAETVPGPAAIRMLNWLDPEAIAVAYVALPPALDPDAIATVFAVPPKAASMLKSVAAINEGLDSILAADAPRTKDWLANTSLAMIPPITARTYIVRPSLRPRAEIEGFLGGAKFDVRETSGIAIWVPQSGFPWKIAFLENDLLGFIPTKEIGSGLGPLTAGRDLPSSPIEDQLRGRLQEEPNLAVELYAKGPLLHFDLGEDILQASMQARSTPQGGLDIQIRLIPDGDVSQAAQTLAARKVPLENDQIQALVKRVAFDVEANRVIGRLELTPNDFSVLRGAP